MKHVISFGVNVAIVILVAWSWLMMAGGRDSGVILTDRSIRSLRYFTVDSNLFMGFAALVYLLFHVRLLTGKIQRVPVWVQTLKLTGTTAVALTFLVVLVFLGPLFGYRSMYVGANLHMHLIVPVLAMAVFCIFETDCVIPMRNILWGLVPMLLYGVFYVGNIAMNGTGSGKSTNDWYGFFSWGIPVGGVIFVVLIAVTWLIGFLLWKGNSVLTAVS